MTSNINFHDKHRTSVMNYIAGIYCKAKSMCLSLDKAQIRPSLVQKHLFRELAKAMLFFCTVHTICNARIKQPWTEKLKYALDHFSLPFPADVTVEQEFIQAEKMATLSKGIMMKTFKKA